ncbi:molybdate transport system ATP-binding protein [Rhizobium sp. RU20A]|uniref:molybdenum ABC transporter ATP-binding protein n=1 Tax=Rhizobium sp. RU20A TaxID=1907412 RepID=UPI0009547F18|nr:molybdenum ABC transporter ATP-binding protein [Rhizobium sp. RU20A]SIQ98584.1 molybdate transport system ATP-binding protein [Rhizobium sp. RU20A]
MTLSIAIRHRLGTLTLDAGFTVPPGVTALFGRSGSGKTSLINAVAGLLAPDAGRVSIDDTVLLDTERRLSTPIHRRRFGYVFQEPRLFPHMTVRQNLAYGQRFLPRGIVPDAPGPVVDLLGITHLLDRRPATLSGGERQRVAIGRALLSAPRALLMDEPLSALDEERKADILPYLERLCRQTRIPILYVSHALQEIALLADRVVVLEAGHMVAEGPASTILSTATLADRLGRNEAGVRIEARFAGEADGLATVRTDSGLTLRIPGLSAPPDGSVRLFVPARDVMIALDHPHGLSALNILPATLVKITPAEDGTVDLTLDCAGTQLLSRITTHSARSLGLAPGRPVHAVIKSVALTR